MISLITRAASLPAAEPVQTISISPVRLDRPGRGRPLELRVTAPAAGGRCPVILLSHGHGPSLYIPSLDGYGPLADFYAGQGFAVIQPTHANSRAAGLDPASPGGPLFWRSRVEDMRFILDSFDTIEAEAPALAGRLDRERVAAVGHSMGGQTVGMLLGARLTDPKDPAAVDVDLAEPRVRAGVLLAAPGNGGADLSDHAAEHYSALNPDFSSMTTRSLVVMGDADVNPHLTRRGADWHADPFHLGPGAEALLVLTGGKHGLGGIAGFDARETDDEDPNRLAVTQRMTAAYLRTALDAADPAWADACAALAAVADLGRVEFKGAPPVRPLRPAA